MLQQILEQGLSKYSEEQDVNDQLMIDDSDEDGSAAKPLSKADLLALLS